MGMTATIRRNAKANYARQRGIYLSSAEVGPGMVRQAKREDAHRLTQTFFPQKVSRQRLRFYARTGR